MLNRGLRDSLMPGVESRHHRQGASLCLRLGGWQATIRAGTENTAGVVQGFADRYWSFLDQPDAACVGALCLVVVCPPVPPIQKPPHGLSQDSRAHWRAFWQTWVAAYRKYCQGQRLLKSPSRQPAGLFTLEWSSNGSTQVDADAVIGQRDTVRFRVLVLDNHGADASQEVFGFSLFLATQWHVDRGGLCLHSCAAARGDDGFVFLGTSGAGKSTTARMSLAAGMTVLGDDLNFVIPGASSDYRLSAAPSAVPVPGAYASLQPRLRGIIVLLQDSHPSLVPMSSLQVARALFESFNQSPSAAKLSKEAAGAAFRSACAVARSVPGYQLHFRKSPDFWRLIDERFPD